MGNDTIRMLKIAKKHHAHLAPIRISPSLRSQLPAWYHPAAEMGPLTSTAAKCLLKKHAVSTVADLISTSARLREPRPHLPHIDNALCPCTDCDRDRTLGCRNPHTCATTALSRIHLITPKYNPLEIGDTHDNLSLTPSRKLRNQEARTADGEIRFDPTITTKSNLADCFRIFTDPKKITNIPARRFYTRGINHRHRGISVYTDGACHNSGKRNARCGSGIWAGPDHPKNAAIRIPGPLQSNQVGEIAAIIAAVDAFPRFWPLTILSDSKYAIDGLTTHLPTWEDNGWIGVKNAPLFKRAAYLLKSRTATTDFKWIKGHNEDIGNEQCDRLAKEGANKPNEDIFSLDIPKEFDLQGAKLASITQAVAYRGIRESQTCAPRPSTDENIRLARTAIYEYNGVLETDKTIWLGTRNRNLRTRVQQFNYKILNNTQKVGGFWSNIPDCVERQNCNICHVTETMEHILIHCDTPSTKTIWDMARNLWPHNPLFWPEISFGITLGCGSIEVRPKEINGNQQDPPKGATRLLQILISEAAHLVWVLRCERVIQSRTHSGQEIISRWLQVINTRLTDDKITATKVKRDEKSARRVRETWEHVLKKQGDLPDGWIDSQEVLVGSGTHVFPPVAHAA